MAYATAAAAAGRPGEQQCGGCDVGFADGLSGR
jgi:hypothetical protein